MKNLDFELECFLEMLKIRLIEEKIAFVYPNQNIRCPTHLSIGQEAVAVGVCKNLQKKDYVFSNHRAHAHYLAKGGSLYKMFAEILGKETGCCRGRGGSMHLTDLESGFIASTPIVAGTIPVAVGAAFSCFIKNEDKITVIFLGEGATETGVFNESLNFASLHNLPILFICENNLYSVYSNLTVRQSKNRDRVKIAEANGLIAKKYFGNDVIKVFDATKKAITQMKKNKKAVYLEFDTYRYKEHCGPFNDNNLNYRPKEEIDYWEKNCPIKITQDSLIKNGYPLKEINVLRENLKNEIDEVFTSALKDKNSFFNIEVESKIYR